MLPQQGYPPQQGGFPPPPGYPQQGGFAPPQGFPQQGGFPPPPGFPQGGFPPPFAAPSKKLSGFERINKDGLYIKQKVDIAEIASGCERQNSYFIHNIDKDGGKLGLETLRAKEESNWCARQCLAGNCRPYKVTVQLRDADLKVHNSAFLEIERPCTCTCLCFARPVVNITHVEDGTRTYLGKIVQPWKCCNCDLNLEVYNASNALTYKVVAKCCQTGVLCGMYPFSPCQTVDFAVETAGGRVVSSFQKKTAGICASMTSNSDNYVVTFPSGASVEDKALLLATALFADYQWFEKRVGITF